MVEIPAWDARRVMRSHETEGRQDGIKHSSIAWAFNKFLETLLGEYFLLSV